MLAGFTLTGLCNEVPIVFPYNIQCKVGYVGVYIISGIFRNLQFLKLADF